MAAQLQHEREELSERVDRYRKGSEEVATKLEQDREVMIGEMRGMREDIKELRAFVDGQQAQTREAVQRISELSAHSSKQLSFVYGELKKNASAQASSAETTNNQLSKLIGLGRRGFMDQLRGKDV